MGGNATAQFTRQANVSSALVDAANTESDGTGNVSTPTMYQIFAADATNGSFVDFVRIIPVASVAGTNTAATVIRIYLCNFVPSGATTNANTFLHYEQFVPIQAASASGAAVNFYDVPINKRIPAGWTLLASTHVVSNANTHQRVTAYGGDY